LRLELTRSPSLLLLILEKSRNSNLNKSHQWFSLK
jgi:hypothetical protein